MLLGTFVDHPLGLADRPLDAARFDNVDPGGNPDVGLDVVLQVVRDKFFLGGAGEVEFVLHFDIDLHRDEMADAADF